MAKRRARRGGRWDRAAQWRSGFERTIREDLDQRGIEYQYEPETIALMIPAGNNVYCRKCGSPHVLKRVRYTPDFRMGRAGDKIMWVEAKGKFTPRDRKLQLAVKEQKPRMDLRMLFQRDNRLSKSSKTKYSDWCNQNGVVYHVGKTIPEEWFK